MSKIVAGNHITAEKGVAKFQSFCAFHNPFLIFREESKHDYGIDGEIELTKRTPSGKIEATGEILKIQLKSTKHKSYIGAESEDAFDFIAKTPDIEYWNNHPIPVILIVYFENEDVLYAKKVEKQYVIKNRGSHKITFNKKTDVLFDGVEFEKVLNEKFVSRIDFSVSETLYVNIHKFQLPHTLRLYESNYSRQADIYAFLKESELSPYPKFVLSSSLLYTFQDLKDYSSKFGDKILKNKTPRTVPIKDFIKKGNAERNLIVWLVKEYLKSEFSKKGIHYNKDLDRHYFANFNSTPLKIDNRGNSVTEFYRYEKSKGKSDRNDKRSVVAKYIYYEKSSFFRHLGFQIFFEWIENELHVIFEPKYLFTEDGKKPLENKERITRLTNQLKQSERNTQYINHLFFLRNYLCHGDLPMFFENERNQLLLKSIEKTQVNFGIKEDTTPSKIVSEADNQMTLF